MEAVSSSETLMPTSKSTLCHNPEDNVRKILDFLVSSFRSEPNYATLQNVKNISG